VRASVKSKIEFTFATEADEAGIRQLLRENPMAGQISLSLEREPDYFTEARHTYADHQTIVARDRGRVVCVGTCSFRQRFVNGQPRRVGYLGGLRLDHTVAGRSDILRRGYRYFRELQRMQPADFYFTAIAADNQRARQFLERGLPGMPRYEYLCDFVTLLVPVPHGGSVAAGVPPAVEGGILPPGPAFELSSGDRVATRVPPGGTPGSTAGETPAATALELATMFDAHNRNHQFAPCWTAEELQALRPLDLRPDDFRVVRYGGKPVACAALWDQRSFKQTVIRGYSAPLAWARPWINLAARLLRKPALPAVGSTLAHATVSHLATSANQQEVLADLIRALFPLARSKGIEWLTLGFAATDLRLAVVQTHFAAREYRSRLYRVRWPDLPGDALDDRQLCPEVALL
jgi:hypothetical protein